MEEYEKVVAYILAEYEKKRRKKTEFMKAIIVWAMVFGTLCPCASFTLSAFGRDPVSDVSITVFSGCTAGIIAYAVKSLGEKISRNKYGLDEYGKPYNSTIKPLTLEDDEEENK